MTTEPASHRNAVDDRDLAQFITMVLSRSEDAAADGLSPDFVNEAVSQFWHFADVRSPGSPKVRVRNTSLGTRRFSIMEVVTDDMPFLVASMLGQLSDIDAVVTWFTHPIVAVERNAGGTRTRLVGSRLEASPLDEALPGVSIESMVLVVFDRVLDGATIAQLEQKVRKVIAEVAIVVADWQALRTRLTETIGLLRGVRESGDSEWEDEVDETCSFLDWLAQEHFVLLGARDYVRDQTDNGEIKPVNESGLGVLRDVNARILRREGQPQSMTPAIEAFLKGKLPIQITKANVRSNVHRRVYMDYIGVKLFEGGVVIGERRFVGLFTSEAYNRTPEQIPLLRRKVETVLSRANFAPNTHNRNALAHILETFPRDELFQIEVDDLFETATGIMRLFERPRPRVFLRVDPFDRFVSALVYLPRERYSSEIREKIGVLLKTAFDGRVSAFYPQLGDAPLVRVHFIIGRNPGPRPAVTAPDLERRIIEIVRSWRDGLADALVQRFDESTGRKLLSRYGNAFNSAYREAFSARNAVDDILRIESLQDQPDIAVRVYRNHGDEPSQIRVKLYRKTELISLSRSLPVLENMGLPVVTEFSYPVTLDQTGNGQVVWLHDFLMGHPRGDAVDLATVTDLFEAAFPAIWVGQAEDDGFNKLIIDAGLSWRETSIFRAIAKYLIQTGSALSKAYMEQTLAQNPKIVHLLLRLFRIRFDPSFGGGVTERSADADATTDEILAALNDIQSLDQDRILRSYLNFVQAALRTNYFQETEGGGWRPTLSFKLDSQAVDGLPLPRPHVEIFVYSPRVEGVHLRFGPIARGGLRWSDRREDFRTEVLGLVKAQYVKNAVIVPVGAKGGFVPKRLPVNGTREEVQAEGIECYRLFVESLLDLTDNLDPVNPAAPPIRPERTITFDAPDPYLVVAADKGTATFSDIANSIALKRRFWLGDAFASGGSNGYDHKAMAITAKGAWEAVKRHFRELGTDIQTTPFTVVGVGDMSGDVFGNAMLLSRKIRLIAAFDHRHIFLDPSPVPELSFEERKRLFALPRSSWDDYDRAKISKGGGVFARTAKSIPLSEEVMAMLGVSETKMAPQALISAILKAKTDLLWFGGIGTYVKSSEERNGEVGDAANDAMRVNGEDLRARVVGEGANLGVTQRGRIEFARAGGRINSDAIDNSAGVDCSDHEVNIKILIDAAVAQGTLNQDARNALLREMTDDVARLVLVDNYDQTLAVSLAEQTSGDDIDAHGRFMRMLEREGRLNRDVEFLPNEEGLAELKKLGRGLSRPEIAVLMAYGKIRLFDEIRASGVANEGPMEQDLIRYFPDVLFETFPRQLRDHRLRREIIATQLANEIVNTGGLTFVNRMRDVTGADTAAVAKAFVVVREVFGIRDLRHDINALDNVISSDLQFRLHIDLRTFLRRQASWLLRRGNFAVRNASELIAHYRDGVRSLSTRLFDTQSAFVRTEIERRQAQYIEYGVSQTVAQDLARLPALWTACDVVDIAERFDADLQSVACVHAEIGASLGLEPLLAAAVGMRANDHWERLAVRRIVEDLLQHQAELTTLVMANGRDVKAWIETHKAAVDRINAAFEELESAGSLTAARFALAVGHVRDLVIFAEAQHRSSAA